MKPSRIHLNEPIRPFLKWPGGKYRLLNTLFKHLPQADYLVEPFVGAGALFLNSEYQKVFVNDINPDLINLYQQLKTPSSTIITQCKKFFVPRYNTPKQYYRLRDRFNRCTDEQEKAALFLYLNRHGYNGLCRYNAKGIYNVPFGHYKKPYFPQDEMLAFTKNSQKASFQCLDFATFLQHFLKQASLKSYVFYCDPPYAPLSKTSNFTSYAKSSFSLEQQYALANLAEKLAQKGARVVISNHDTPQTREIYQGAKIKKVVATRSISCKGQGRGKVSELLAIY